MMPALKKPLTRSIFVFTSLSIAAAFTACGSKDSTNGSTSNAYGDQSGSQQQQQQSATPTQSPSPAPTIAASPLPSASPSSSPSSSPSASPSPSPSASVAAQAVSIPIAVGAMGKGPAAFGTNPLTIPMGTTVTWINNDTIPHTSTSTTGVWDSGTLNNGQSFSFTFSNPGTFPYFCSIHGAQSMSGTIVVQ